MKTQLGIPYDGRSYPVGWVIILGYIIPRMRSIP